MSFLTLKNLWKLTNYRLRLLTVCSLAGLLLTFGGTWFWKKSFHPVALPLFESPQPVSETLLTDFMRQLQVIHSLIEQSYVEPLSSQKKKEMLEGAFLGMIKTLDPHSSYLTPDMMQELNESMRGQFCGVGLEVVPDASGGLRIISAIDETEAARAGLCTGDLILKIDHKWLFDLPPHETIRYMRGRPGSFVTLTVRRPGSTPFEVRLKRHTVNFKSVQWNREPGNIGYLRISYFDDKTKRLVLEALASFQKSPSFPLNGLLIDLRNNPGGLLEQAIGVADILLEKGAIVSTRTADNPEGTIVYANPKTKQLIHKIPLLLLVNPGTASGAELLASALQENYRALIVGERTFGKASMQAVYPLEKGAGLKLTIAQYDTPSGKSIQAEGIQPDILIPAHYEVVLKPSPLPIREENLHAHRQNERILPEPEQERERKDLAPPSHMDFQKTQALDILRALAAHQRNLNSRLEDTPSSPIPFETIAQRE